jgi:hypothetical protein
MASMRGLAGKAAALGVEIVTGITVTDSGQAMAAPRCGGNLCRHDRLRPSRRRGGADQFDWNMLALPSINVGAATARCMTVCGCGTTWRCRKARSASTPVPEDERRLDAAGDSRRHRCAALFRSRRPFDHRQLWGLYKPTSTRRRQGGAMPAVVTPDPTRCVSIPTGRSRRVRGDGQLRGHVDLGARVLPEALRRSACQVSGEPSGGIGCFTPDSFLCSTASARTST